MTTSVRRTHVLVAGLLLTSLLGSCTTNAHRAQSQSRPASPAAPLVTPPSATPTEPGVRGGTLRVIGSGTDYLDPNISYYSVGYSLLRLFSRQLYTWPADPANATDVVPDLATTMPTVDATRTVYTVTIRPGARWESSPPRQVTAADVVRGVETTCNPAQPSGALPDFESVIKGMTEFCQEFAKAHPNPHAIGNFVKRNFLPGVHVGANRLQVVFELTRPVNYFRELLALPALSPRPREMLAELPGGDRGVSHPISDGPYRLAAQVPADYGAPSLLTFDRNPTWSSSTDPNRRAYVARIRVDFGLAGYDPEKTIRRLKSGADDLCLCGIGQPYNGRLLRQHDPRFSLHAQLATNPYLVFNTVSPNNGGALRNPDVRRAISYALDRSAFTKALGGPALAPPLTHVLPDGVTGSQPFDPYPHDVAQAKELLRKAGVTHLFLWGYLRSSSPTANRIYDAMQKQLAAVGVRLRNRPTPDGDFTNLLSNPVSARRGEWDVALAGWLPDWQGKSAAAYFRPMFDGRTLPPTSSNFGLYDDPAVDQLIDQASQADPQAAAGLWHRADELVMKDAPIYPIAQPNAPMWCGTRVRSCVYMPALNGVDLTNVWLRRRA